MRIRDKLFPEGTKIRSILRKLAILSKGLLPRNWKKIFETIKNRRNVRPVQRDNFTRAAGLPGHHCIARRRHGVYG